jgi:dihydroorotate dehydrogenase (fumarate)
VANANIRAVREGSLRYDALLSESPDLSVNYLGLRLVTPLVVGASPFADDTHTARQVQDAGAGAIVMRSLFEEQIYLDEFSRSPPSGERLNRDQKAALFPALSEYQLSPAQYIRQISDLKAALSIPVIASLNGCRPGGWIDLGRRFEVAGADAIELNLYNLSADPASSAREIEAGLLETVRLMKSSVCIPVAVKLQPYYTALAHFVRQLEQTGADGIVLFNRVYQSDFDIDEQEPLTQLPPADPGELLVRLRWLALLSPKARCSLAITGGVQNGGDAIKAILAGADAVQLVSVLLRHGPRFLGTVVDGLRQWMEAHGYRRVGAFRGNMNRHGIADAGAVERGDYQRLLQQWRI